MIYLQTIDRFTQTKKTIKKSRFIASVKEVKTETEARVFIKEISQQFPDANHHCWAYQCGNGKDTISQYSDGGEPVNSAGPPILQAIKREKITNVMIIVSRYFGGIKLGISGLIRAYRDTALKGLKEAGKVKKFALREYIVGNIQYQVLGNILQAIESKNGHIENIEYDKEVKITAYLDEDIQDWITRLVENATQGKGNVKMGLIRWYHQK